MTRGRASVAKQLQLTPFQVEAAVEDRKAQRWSRTMWGYSCDFRLLL